ncbi:MAG: hypothetical protein A2Y07_00025 [Planctomycetes bacterium GWF2_50_10]|nr:MAG: hypothetical protein A2Y07_00025 [Planctomycetes bacterium GWF2_50_10]
MAVHNLGIIGYGGFGRFLHHCWSQMDNVKVVAVSDKVASRFSGLENIHVYSEWRNLVHNPEVEIVAIATVPYTHEMIATAAMEAQKAVLIEKPLATTTLDAGKIIAEQEKRNTPACIDYIMRFNPMMKRLAAISSSGVLGKIRRIDVENYAQDEQLPPDHWFWDQKLGGGILIEHAVHFIDLVHLFTDAPAIRVSGFGHMRNAKQQDQVIANVLYEDGLFATHYHSFARPGFFEITTMKFAYDLATIDLVGWIPLRGTIEVLVNTDTRAMIESLPGYELINEISIEKAIDESRPAGWGPGVIRKSAQGHIISSGGIDYTATSLLRAKFKLEQPKSQIYCDCVRAVLEDLIKAIEDPSHKVSASLKDGLKSLDIAQKAVRDSLSTV